VWERLEDHSHPPSTLPIEAGRPNKTPRPTFVRLGLML